jgi:hypothetical protein
VIEGKQNDPEWLEQQVEGAAVVVLQINLQLLNIMSKFAQYNE